MKISQILQANRSFRRYLEEDKVPLQEALRWVKNLRYTNSMRNAQPLKYILVDKPTLLEKIYPLLRWAGYLKDWNGPEKGERPPLLIVQLLDKDCSSTARFDEGLQLSALTLQATEAGYGCCILAAFDASSLVSTLAIPSRFTPLAIVAIGHPKEHVVIEEQEGENIKYFRSSDGIHHVPKRKEEELILTIPEA